ncbi:MAG: hypothetical protein HYR72_20295 [Deltaproteobacteria bacterium]|nr:hypothetical protein [Deltaproteobacteria bacterium]
MLQSPEPRQRPGGNVGVGVGVGLVVGAGIVRVAVGPTDRLSLLPQALTANVASATIAAPNPRMPRR